MELRTRDCAGLPELADAVCAAVRTRVPYVFGCLATTDPSTGLISWAWKTHPLDVGDEEFAAAEYGGPDVNLFAELAARPEPVGVLSLDTAGEPHSCRRFREFLAPRFGFTDELRVVFRSQGLTWGALALYRGPGEPPFSHDDARTAASIHAQVARLIQTTLFSAPPGAASAGPGPAVIVVDGADRVSNLTPGAHARIAELGGWDNGSLPPTVLAATAAARSTAHLATTRAVSCSGAWLVIRATHFATAGAGAPANSAIARSSEPRDAVVVTIDVASPSDVSSLALAARGLSPREQQIATLVLQGAATKTIAAALFLSPHTVQDHLKSIFAKLDVNSRREMVQQLVLG